MHSRVGLIFTPSRAARTSPSAKMHSPAGALHSDGRMRWTPTGSGALEGVEVALSVQNLFNEDPPFYDSPLGVGYDPANASPLGRTVALQISRRW